MRLVVKADGTVLLTVPLPVSDAEAMEFVNRKRDWIERVSAKMRAIREEYAAVAQPEKSSKETEALMQATEARAEEWRKMMKAPEVIWRWRRMRTLWGSCNYRHNPPVITLNRCLTAVPQELTDLILVHELSHLFHRNHSPRFHEHVRCYLPDEKAREKRLKIYTPLLRSEQQGKSKG
jgi:hypothetical protein